MNKKVLFTVSVEFSVTCILLTIIPEKRFVIVHQI